MKARLARHDSAGSSRRAHLDKLDKRDMIRRAHHESSVSRKLFEGFIIWHGELGIKIEGYGRSGSLKFVLFYESNYFVHLVV